MILLPKSDKGLRCPCGSIRSRVIWIRKCEGGIKPIRRNTICYNARGRAETRPLYPLQPFAEVEMSSMDSIVDRVLRPDSDNSRRKFRRVEHKWHNIRKAVIARDKGCCVVCGADTFKQQNDWWNLYQFNHQMAYSLGARINVQQHFREVDHIVPVFRGGTNEMHNLRLLCVLCHKNKTRSDWDAKTREIGNRMLDELADPERQAFVKQVIAALGFRKREVIRHRYALDGYKQLTRNELSDVFKVTRTRMRQIEMEAITDVCIALDTDTLPNHKEFMEDPALLREPLPEPKPTKENPAWTLKAFRQPVLQARVYVYDKWRGRKRPWNRDYVCWARRIDENKIEIFNTEGDTAQDAIDKAKRRIGYAPIRIVA